jgi:hypothetical protein
MRTPLYIFRHIGKALQRDAYDTNPDFNMRYHQSKRKRAFWRVDFFDTAVPIRDEYELPSIGNYSRIFKNNKV